MMNYLAISGSKIVIVVVAGIDLELVYFLNVIGMLRLPLAVLLGVAVLVSKYPLLNVFTRELTSKQLRLAMLSSICSFVLSIIAGLFFFRYFFYSISTTAGLLALILAPLAVFVKIWIFIQLNILKTILIANTAYSSASAWLSGPITEET